MMFRAAGCACLIFVTIHAAPAQSIPISGEAVAGLETFDRAMTDLMRTTDLPAGVLAVSRHGVIIYQRGFGLLDGNPLHPVTPGTPMRLASVCKPLTAACVRQLIAEGKLKLEDRVFDLLLVDPPPDAHPDPRLARITIRNLLEHRGGWDREKSFDPMFHDAAIRERLHINRAPTAPDIIRYMMDQPLDFDPGERYAYSNFGYCLLGRVIEKATGQPYIEAMRARVAAPLMMSTLALAHTEIADRDPHEPAYFTGNFKLYTERMDAHGGLIASAPDLLRFAAAYQIDGFPRRRDARIDFTFFGAMPGTCSMLRQRPDGVDIAVIFNKRAADLEAIKKTFDDAAAGIAHRPER
ncbi:MAG: serine hydrolase [Planctomycetes bacterium]|nr:serine hydrolase [Planctomycetota bacterium]